MRSIMLVTITLTVQAQSVAAQDAIRPVFPPMRLIAELDLEAENLAPAVNGRRIYIATDAAELWLYDVASQRTTKVAADALIVPTSISSRGNRLAFLRCADDGSACRAGPGHGSIGRAIWTMPLDPRTGLAAGPARRVSIGDGLRPSLSPDGAWIAFESLVGRRHLAVIPSDGGNERVLLDEIEQVEYIKWSPDQQWLYFSARLPGWTAYLPMRVAVAGGKPEMIAQDQFQFQDGEVGLSPDGKFLAVTVRASASGALVLALLDVDGKLIAMVPWADSWLSSSELLLWYRYRPKPLKSVSLADGEVREVLTAAYDIGTAAWAPDGKSFAVLSRAHRGASHPDSSRLLIANADGSSLRTIPVRASSPFSRSSASRLVWSPDGRWIAMTERPWLGAQQLFGLGITAVDVASGTTQRLRTGVSQDIANLRWTSDSKHVLYDYSPSDRPSAGGTTFIRRVIRLVGLDGSDVVVRTLPRAERTHRSGGSGLTFISDTSVLVSDNSGTYVRSLTSDRFVSAWSGGGTPSASPGGELVAMSPRAEVPGDTSDRARRTADIVTSTGVHVATLRFPSDLLSDVSGSFLFTPDGKSLLTWGRSEAGGCCKLYVAPLDGGPVRALAEFPNQGIPGFALSPDGKTLLVTPSGPTKGVLSLWAVDLSGLLRGARKN